MTTILILAAAAVLLGYGYLIWSVGHRPVRPADRRMTAVHAELTAAERTRR